MKAYAILTALVVSPLALSAEDKVDFAKEVLPVLEEKCMSCHRETYTDPRTSRPKKPKSGYRMDTAEFILGAGDENEENVVAGKPDDSPSYTYTQLPEDDDYHMPTKGDDLTEDEAKLLKKWIEEGADLGDWKETKFEADGTKIEADGEKADAKAEKADDAKEEKK